MRRKEALAFAQITDSESTPLGKSRDVRMSRYEIPISGLPVLVNFKPPAMLHRPEHGIFNPSKKNYSHARRD